MLVAAMICGVSLWKNCLPYWYLPTWEVELLAPLGGGIGKLIAGVHIPAVVVFHQNQVAAAQCRADGGTHADVHTPVAADHEKGDLALGHFSAFLPLVEHFHQPRYSGPVLEKVVHIGTLKEVFGLGGGDHHAAPGLEQKHHVSFDAPQKRFTLTGMPQPGQAPCPGARRLASGWTRLQARP